MASTSAKATATKSILKPVTTLKSHGQDFGFGSISYFPDGQRMISTCHDDTVRQWDLKAGREIEEARDVWKKEVLAVAVSRDGRWVVTAGGDDDTGELKACEVETGIVKEFKGHSRRIDCIDISADGTLLASGAMDRTVRIWSLDTGQLVAGPFDTAIDDWLGAVRFSMDSKKLAMKFDSGTCLEVWDVQTQKLDASRRKEMVEGYIVNSHAPIFWTNKNKNILAPFTFTDGYAEMIYEFDASTLETIGTPFEGHTKVVTGLALSSDCTLLASTSDDYTIKLWAFESRKLLASFDVQHHRTRALVLSPDSRQLGYIHNEIHICNIPPDILAQARTSPQSKSTTADVLRSHATRRPPAVRRRPPIPAIPMSQRPHSSINPQQPIFLRLRKLLPFSSRTNAVPAVQNSQTRGPVDFRATSPLPPNRLHTERSSSTPLPNVRSFFNSIRFSSDKGKKTAREPKRKPVEVVDVPLGQATYGDVVGVDDGKRQYVVFFCLSWFQKKEKMQVPRPVYDDDLDDDDDEEEDILNRVAMPHARAQDQGVGLKTVASQQQPGAGPSRLAKNDNILNRVAVPHPRRVQDEDIALETAAGQSQPRAGPSRLVNNVDILNRVAVPHPRVQDEDNGLKTAASGSQPRAGPSRHVNSVDILNRVAVRPHRVQHEEIELKPMASLSQPEAGPSRLVMIDEHLEAQSS
ncbi:hypothetical protein DEU56DRAFT_920332 [Suillus clintonianus]|uniref:uncharacterized protein n=1 Tax=Suillus clintonianus TaxID=1904413 RepID=UPI001B85B5C3|nr:uncharacterized protein DEU56DRAFT_920332 [Suillus clintonianus]KAG2109512.1 hypothetical protein DEU56DRAFT_920332 [Suillus clintonianus]